MPHAAPRLVLVTTFDTGYVRSGLVANWLESVTRVGLRDRVVLYPMDPEAAEYARGTGCETIELWPHGEVASASITAFDDAAFRDVTLRKFVAIRDQLERGRAVVFSDADIVFLEDPLPHLAEYEEDVVTQSDVGPNAKLSQPRPFPPKWLQRRRGFRNTLCAGFLRALPSPAVLRVFDASRAGTKDFAHDQEVLHHRLVWNDEATWALLPQDRFPNGARIAIARWRNGDDAALEGAVIAHVNWCIADRKIELLKELGCWYVEE